MAEFEGDLFTLTMVGALSLLMDGFVAKVSGVANWFPGQRRHFFVFDISNSINIIRR